MASVALAVLAFVVVVTAPSQAAAAGSHGFGGAHPGGAGVRSGFEGRHFEGRHFEGHRFDGRFGLGFGPVVPYYGYYDAPGYWYYCPSYGAYYPNVGSCPEAWVPVPAS